MKQSSGLLAWRRKQARGAIMKPETFHAIEARAASSGADNPERVAGAAYWKTARTKYAGRESGRRSGR